MAQTEKYMLLEKEEMFLQKIQSLEALLSSTLGGYKGPDLPSLFISLFPWRSIPRLIRQCNILRS